MILRFLAAGLSLSCLATPVLAQEAPRPHKWYVELTAGESTLDHEPGFSEIDNTSSSWSVRAGYRFTRFFALEAGYVDIGDYSSVAGTSPVVSQTSSFDGLLLNSRFLWPVARHFQLNASAGLLYHERDTTYDSTSGFSSEDTYSNVGFSFGVGIAVPVNDRFEVGLDYTEYFELGVPFNFSGTPSLTTESDTSVVSLALRFRF
jgi:OOP family OmpA-OmpF porin